jgi:hypothetical protein
MNDRDRIATYYSNAKELVKQNNPKAARAYVLAILNAALETYKTASTILLKAKTQGFLDKWVAVSRELYDKGVTDYVLKCFKLPTKQEQELPKVSFEQPKPASEKIPPQKPIARPSPKDKPGYSAPDDGGIDIAGLIDETAKTQGWCAEVFEKNKNAVVEIHVSATSSAATGTGFIISNNGYLLTNDHVVFNEQTGGYYPKVKMSFVGDKKSYSLTVLFSDKTADVALCRFDSNEIQGNAAVKRISDYSHLLPGADCLVIGNACGLGLAPITGVVRYIKDEDGNLVYTALSNHGDSGAPVFNRQGECIGIHKSRTTAVDGDAVIGFSNATPMDRIDELLFKWTSANDITL